MTEDVEINETGYYSPTTRPWSPTGRARGPT